MKRINILYIVAILAVIGLWSMNLQYNQETVMFYGFAENKETEINIEHAVQVDKILVTTGQKVTKGTPLLEASHNKLPLKLNELVYEKAEANLKKQSWKAEILSSIDKLKSKKAIKTSEIQAKIAQIEAKVAQNRALVKEMKTVSSSDGKKYSPATQAKIDALNNELKNAILPLDNEIARLEQQLQSSNSPYDIQMQKLQSEQSFYEDKGRKLHIFAPTDGLIGNIHCKEAENIASFKTLITFYEENPTLVMGYVHEKMVVHVNIGDSVIVTSSVHKDNQCTGIVTGLGSRMIEIPVRLRKYPEIKNYGREVLIKIPAENAFLQKEKVTLKTNKKVDSSKNFFEYVFNLR